MKPYQQVDSHIKQTILKESKSKKGNSHNDYRPHRY